MATEAPLRLNRLAKNQKAAFIESGAFTTGTVGPTPAAKCCEGANHRCPVDESLWKDPIWKGSDFYVDEPHYFRYSYTGTATAFTATAVGDLDCDGEEITYTLVGSVEDGNPKTQLTEPAKLD